MSRMRLGRIGGAELGRLNGDDASARGIGFTESGASDSDATRGGPGTRSTGEHSGIYF